MNLCAVCGGERSFLQKETKPTTVTLVDCMNIICGIGDDFCDFAIYRHCLLQTDEAYLNFELFSSNALRTNVMLPGLSACGAHVVPMPSLL